jgi:acyl carrier protein
MVPLIWVELESIPLTPNGKVDKRALPKPDLDGITTLNYVAPQTELQTQLVEVWQDVLSIQKIGIQDDFFELGGQSIIAMRTISAIRKQLNFELGVRELFTYRNILDLSNYFEQQSSASAVKSISKIKSRLL